VGIDLVVMLFGKPEWELSLRDFMDLDFADELREYADSLRNWLYRVADLHEKLLRNGWYAAGGMYDITYYKDVSMKEAERELKKLGLEDFIDDLIEWEE